MFEVGSWSWSFVDKQGRWVNRRLKRSTRIIGRGGGLEGQYINERQRNIGRPRRKGFAWRREYFRSTLSRRLPLLRVRAWECSQVWRVRQLLRPLFKHPHSLTPWKWEDRPAPPTASVPIYRWDNRLTAEFTASSSLLTGGSGARSRHKPSWVTALGREVLPTTRMSADPPRPAPSLIRPSCWCLFPSHIHAK